MPRGVVGPQFLKETAQKWPEIVIVKACRHVVQLVLVCFFYCGGQDGMGDISVDGSENHGFLPFGCRNLDVVCVVVDGDDVRKLDVARLHIAVEDETLRGDIQISGGYLTPLLVRFRACSALADCHAFRNADSGAAVPSGSANCM